MQGRNDLVTRLRGGFGRFGGKLAALLIAGGLLAILLGWNGAASDIRPAAQFPYLLSGLGFGLSLVAVGAALMVVQSAREDRARLEAKLDVLVDAVTRSGGMAAAGGPAAPANLAGLVVAGSASYHAPGCRLVDGREEVTYLTPDEARSRWLAPCRVCQPEASAVGG